MAIDWKTIISEFDGKPTLLQAIGKLRKAVEDETITIQQAQAEIAKLESQQKADEALIKTAQSTADEAKINAYNASQKGDQALGKATTADKKAQAADTKAQAADTKAQQALNLATTNETDITALQNKASIEITLEPSTVTRGTLTDEQLSTLLLNDNCYIKHNGIIYTLFKRSDTVLQYTAGYLNDTKNIQNIKVLVNSKAWTIENIALPQAKIYKHHVKIVIDDLIYDKEFTGNAYIDIISSNNLTVASVTDIKTLLGDTFITDCYGFANVEAEGQKIVYEANQNSISCQGYQIPWSAVTITDTVTTI